MAQCASLIASYGLSLLPLIVLTAEAANVGFRFRKSIRIAPGLRLNLSGSGASVSLGPRGLTYNMGKMGTRLTAGIPGTGLSWSQYKPYSETPSPGPTSKSWASPPAQEAYADAPIESSQPNPHATPIESAPTESIAALSTSELAPALSKVGRRVLLAPFALLIGAGLFATSAAVEATTLWAGLYTVTLLPAFVWLDRYRKSVSINYDLTAAAKVISDALDQSFAPLQQSQRVWQIDSFTRTNDWKRNAGASELNDRRKAASRKGRPQCIRGNLSLPSLLLAKESLYFLPDAILVVDRKSVTALDYDDIEITANVVRFIESEKVPTDTQIVDQTWRYVNKKGGPDRRFNFNKQLPVCLYSEIAIQSAGGLNARLHFSNPAAAETFIRVIEVARKYTSDKSQFRSITSVRFPSRWPTISLLVIASLFAAFVASGWHRLPPLLISGTDRNAPAALSNDGRTQPNAFDYSFQNVSAVPAIGPTNTQNKALSLVKVPLPRPRSRPRS
jgi:hypothetical protein